MDFKSYQQDVQFSIEEIDRNIHWHKVGEILNLDDNHLALLKSITRALKPKHLTAYALTELMPSADGELNKNVMEFLLKSAGSRYVYSIPSTGDDEISFGPYQFTKKAPGTWKVNGALSESKRIPDHVAKFRGVAHHKAALLLAIYNLGCLIKQLNQREFKVLHEKWRDHITAITQFIAVAHHAPGPARSSAKRWLDAEAKHAFEVSVPDEKVYKLHEY